MCGVEAGGMLRTPEYTGQSHPLPPPTHATEASSPMSIVPSLRSTHPHLPRSIYGIKIEGISFSGHFEVTANVSFQGSF